MHYYYLRTACEMLKTDPVQAHRIYWQRYIGQMVREYYLETTDFDQN